MFDAARKFPWTVLSLSLAGAMLAGSARSGDSVRDEWFDIRPNTGNDSAWRERPEGGPPVRRRDAPGPGALDSTAFERQPPVGTGRRSVPSIVREDPRNPLRSDPTRPIEPGAPGGLEDEFDRPLGSIPLDRHWGDIQRIRSAGVEEESMLLERLADLTDPLAPEAVVALVRLQRPPAGRRRARPCNRTRAATSGCWPCGRSRASSRWPRTVLIAACSPR